MTELRERMALAAGDPGLALRLGRALDHTIAARAARVAEASDWDALRDAAAATRRYSLSNLDHLLERFESNASASGMTLHYAADAGRACGTVIRLLGSSSRPVIKSKSMVTEEIGLRTALRRARIPVVETDLGEYIVQVAGEAPSHIVAPVIHKSAADIASLFRSRLGVELGDDADPRTISLAARDILRPRFVEASLGICGANFLTADEGAVVVCTNEGNGGWCLSVPERLIVVTGIEKLNPSLRHLEAPLLLLGASATGQRQTCYTHVLRAPGGGGPERIDIVLVDNGRSRALADGDLWEALACIRCGACMNVCPVYRACGGQAYGWVYPGPIGIPLAPFLRPGRRWSLADACTLCGACSDVCPVRIDLPNLILAVRARPWRRLPLGALCRAAAGVLARPRLFEQLGRAVRRRARRGAPVRYGPAAGWSLVRDIPAVPGQSFSEMWRRGAGERDGDR